MARDKAKDDLMFNCSQQHEIDFVKRQYTDPATAEKHIKAGCSAGIIKNWTHKKVYEHLASKGLKEK